MSRIRPYEVVYIFDASLEEQAIHDRLARFHSLIASSDTGAPVVNHWGKRTLAYPIRKRETGYYVVAQFDAAGEALPEFERAVKLDEGVIRYLLVINDKDYAPTREPGERKDGEEDEA